MESFFGSPSLHCVVSSALSWVGKESNCSPTAANNSIQVTISNYQNDPLSQDTTSIILPLVAINNVVTSYTINVYNNFGLLVFSGRKTGDTFTISVANLKDGIYIVEANDGKLSYSQQLIIKH